MFPLQNQSVATVRQPRVISLSSGQLFQGRITKIFPNNVAALSANGMQLTARLEVALTVGQRYWFEVKDATGLPRLKVLDDNKMRREGSVATTEKLLHQLGLPPSKAMEKFIGQLVALKIPFSKEALLISVQVLTELNELNERGYHSIAKMLQMQLPISKESFLAFQSMSDQQPLTTQLLKLDASLAQVNIETAQEVKELIGKMVKPGSFHTTNSPIAQLFSLVMKEEPGAMQLLVRLGIVKEGTSTQQLYGLLKQVLSNPKNQQLVERLWPSLSHHVSQDVHSLMSNLQIPGGKEGLHKLEQLLTLVSSQESAEQVHAKWLQLPTNTLRKEEKAILQQVLESSTNVSSKETAGAHLKSILTMLGLQYEHDVTRVLQGDGSWEIKQANRLKALLMSLQQQELPQASKDQVIQTLQRLTGQQLLMQEQNGLFHQILFHVPIALGSYQTELTMQWEGKKREEGELDPTFCRVLFYLTLERLQETVIDLQIQNRFVTVMILNENDKPQILIDLLTPSLKRALVKQDYQLSSINWKKISEQQNNRQVSVYQQKSNYQGVDIRI
ncbi:hypothetical protein [Halalkalibacter alkalisediminis]|uniref:Flagellar hook-length control protein FliK n=1 Tax=Halalkalibacter alkalisediminis TaxID=935616 RepID=A0ABV6NEL5_9BACI|nr:hypothetical protein [Halalkalibacter alkalisediminis]